MKDKFAMDLILFFVSMYIGISFVSGKHLKVLTVATEKTDGYNRYISSIYENHLDVKVLGMGDVWRGGDVRRNVGGGQKVRLLKSAVQSLKDENDLIILFTDSYDVIVDAGADDILKLYQRSNASILFSAEGFCWPDKSLANQYPVVKWGKRYLNSGGFIGAVKNIWEMLQQEDVLDDDDDQLYYTRIYLNANLRSRLNIHLDSTSTIFQNLHGAEDDVDIKFADDQRPRLKNFVYGTMPVVIHGNGLSKIVLNRLGNYLANYWTPKEGCSSCKTNALQFENVMENDLPLLCVAVFIEKPVPFLKEFLHRLLNQTYSKRSINLILHNTQNYHKDEIDKFVNEYAAFYHKFVRLNDANDKDAREKSLDEAYNSGAKFILMLDGEAMLTNRDAIRLLVEQDRHILAPMLVREGKLWSNFWGAINKEGFYARSEDYLLLLQRKRIGVWNVPFVGAAVVISRERMPTLKGAFSYNQEVDADMSFAQFNRDNGYFMHVNNLHQFGHLVDTDYFDTTHLHNELYQIFQNRLDWEHRYLHENYSKVLEDDFEFEQPCTDVFWFPFVSDRWCWEIIEEMENFGKWSDGSNQDTRLTGGYENVPTRDIHMNQVGLEQHWLKMLDDYIRPVQERVFAGYFHRPPQAVMNFVVRYRPDEQPALRPHNDASTYTVNMNLNRPGVDYEGGGPRFLRYNCSVTGVRQGWALLHPGRLTHHHEGLPTTKGTRYIMISFVDP